MHDILSLQYTTRHGDISCGAWIGYFWAVHLTSEVDNWTNVVCKSQMFQCLCLLFYRDDDFSVFSINVDALCNNFVSMWHGKLFLCHSRHHFNLSTIPFWYDLDEVSNFMLAIVNLTMTFVNKFTCRQMTDHDCVVQPFSVWKSTSDVCATNANMNWF